MTRFTPSNCPHCEYDRRFPELECGGWIQQDNNGPIVSCPVCNDDGAHPRPGCTNCSDITETVHGLCGMCREMGAAPTTAPSPQEQK